MACDRKCFTRCILKISFGRSKVLQPGVLSHAVLKVRTGTIPLIMSDERMTPEGGPSPIMGNC